MLEVREAAKKARQYLSEVYDSGQVKDILVEEVQASEDHRYWVITLGFDRLVEPRDNLPGALQTLVGGAFKREYKMFEIDRSTGQVLSMKIRVL